MGGDALDSCDFFTERSKRVILDSQGDLYEL